MVSGLERKRQNGGGGGVRAPIGCVQLSAWNPKKNRLGIKIDVFPSMICTVMEALKGLGLLAALAGAAQRQAPVNSSYLCMAFVLNQTSSLNSHMTSRDFSVLVKHSCY